MNRSIVLLLLMTSFVMLPTFQTQATHGSVVQPQTTATLPSGRWNMDQLAMLGGNASALAVDGTQLVAGYSAGLLVIDTTTITQPQVLGFAPLPNHVADVVLIPGYAYAATYSGLAVVDRSDPAHPHMVGDFLDVPSGKLALANTTLYLAAGDTGLFIFDLSNPIYPRQIGVVNRSVRGIALEGDYLYTVNGSEMLVFATTDPQHLQLVTTLQLPAVASAIHLDAGYAYLDNSYNYSTISIIDVHDPTHPLLVSSDQYGGVLAKDGNLLYTLQMVILTPSVSGCYVRVLNVSDPAHPAATYGPRIYCTMEAEIVGNTLSVADSSSGIAFLDTTTFLQVASVGVRYGVAPVDTVKYGTTIVTASYYQVALVDVSNPVAPIELAKRTYVPSMVNFGLSPQAVAVKEPWLFLLDSYNFQIFDLRQGFNDNASPVFTVPTQCQNCFTALAINGNYLYLVDASNQSEHTLKTFDITNPPATRQIGQLALPISGWAWSDGLKMSAGHLYLLAENGLSILSLTNPAAPTLVASRGDLLAQGLDTAGDLLALGTADGLQLWSISDPVSPQLVGSTSVANGCRYPAINGTYLVANCNLEDLVVFDITDRAQPIPVAVASKGGGPLVADGDLIYANNYTDFSIFRFTGLSLSGTIADTTGKGVGGIQLSLSNGQTTQSNAAGDFYVGRLTRGSYTVTPTLAGFTITPISRTMTLPTLEPFDFQVSAAAIETPLTPTAPTSMTFDYFQGWKVTLAVPMGAVTATTRLRIQTLTDLSGGSQRVVGMPFALEAQQGATQLDRLNVPITITLQYDDQQVQSVSDEATLGLYRWNGTGWQGVTGCGAGAVIRDMAANRLTTTLCAMGNYAFLGASQRVFLPQIVR